MTAISELINPMPGCRYKDTWLAPRLGGASKHYGCDISRLPDGKLIPYDYPIKACLPGTVEKVSRNWRAGNFVWILTETDKGAVITSYCHLNSFAVKRGDRVEKGELVGGAGNTGNSSTVHLHLAITINGRRVNPYPYLIEADKRARGEQEVQPLLKYGSRGGEVRQLQSLLIEEGYRIKADGIFGKATRAAVQKFQKSKGLIADGIVGPLTWAALK
ncbi:MAG: peptidoglycan DD-metalloendopeptidase family protein [Bacillota bacterium]|nr:peptidoglycan DD-metalloendopeptidase family protein [Bacillota bacterium]